MDFVAGRAGPMTDDDIERMVREVPGLGPMSPLEFREETAKLRAYAVRRRRERERERDRSGPDFEREKACNRQTITDNRSIPAGVRP